MYAYFIDICRVVASQKYVNYTVTRSEETIRYETARLVMSTINENLSTQTAV